MGKYNVQVLEDNKSSPESSVTEAQIDFPGGVKFSSVCATAGYGNGQI
jgi:hypothetical protein